ncbi:MAG: FAD-binding protein [Chloroflexota bacterium]
MKEEIVKCDVLCVGGGIAGLMAAIRAREMGADVVVAEKANTLRSGSAGAGNDHFQCYIPEVHGDFDFFWKELFFGQLAGRLRLMDREYVRFWYENTYDIVKMWDKWGIPMKYEGRWEFAGHGFPGKQLNHLKYSGVDQKPVLTRQTLKSGAKIRNRVMVFDVLKNKDGSVAGAVGADVRDDKIVIFEAPSVILGTGGCLIMYPPVTAGAHYNRTGPITLSGDGRAMAYRAGAELKDLEISKRHAGPKYFVRSGQATWVGVLRDRNGKPVGPFVTKPDRMYGDMTTEVSKAIYDQYAKSGKGPIYMDMNGISQADLDYMVYWLLNEGNGGLLAHIAEEGIDLSKAAVEFQTFDFNVSGGVRANYRGETAVPGLYAAGDEVSGTISHAAVFGRSSGENAARHAKEVKGAGLDQARSEIEEKKALLAEISARENGPTWQEALSAMQQIMLDYCGAVRSETLLSAGLENIRRLRKKVRASLTARNPHELMHCLQVLNGLDIGEATFFSALDRQETRDFHVRADFTLTNPLLSDKVHMVKQVAGKPATEWRQVKA